ncbi:hypothetical protein LXM25_16645 [Dyadobacter sp. LJ53]|uniref:hypothetical protein n=1 Tax=Dyadobacter chenwenxiniae TaxID=2906456 RepID=UPI001F20857A|nr:hypothetical protein [Dyadobacter chenwenxiniae]MCF0051700.1 hypothetical protein [Dyadobacter chenwenxiniae]
MQKRKALLVGSLPFDNEKECMSRALDMLGSKLLCVPDGEIGEKTPAFPKGDRIAWVVYALEKITQDEKSWKIVKQPTRGADGMAIDYDHFQKLTPLRTPSEMPAHVHLGYDKYFEKSYPVFQGLLQEKELPKMKFQVGFPTGFAMGFAFASQIQWLRYTYAFNTVFAREINAIKAQAGDNVIIQLEVPAELYAAHMLPALLTGLALKPILDLLSKIDPGAEIGIHLCLGDFHNEALIHPKTLDRIVRFSNLLVETWPPQHKLAYMHYPFAEAQMPPSEKAAHYKPLKDIQLPGDTRFVAGFVHEAYDLDRNRVIRDNIENGRGSIVDIACSCGLGRRTPAIASRLMQFMAALSE